MTQRNRQTKKNRDSVAAFFAAVLPGAFETRRW